MLGFTGCHEALDTKIFPVAREKVGEYSKPPSSRDRANFRMN